MAIQNNIKIGRPYFENLDALRFLAAFSVFIFHFFNEISATYQFNSEGKIYKLVNLLISKGSLGVNFFFVLSGFLITFLILWERKQTGTFNVKHFLIRRSLRIWPMYFMIVLIGFVLFPAVINGYSTCHSLSYYALFLANFDEIRVGLTDSINFLTAPWSVAVEEQFYLFWGILLFGLNRLKFFKLPLVLVILLLISIAFSYFNQSSIRVLYYHTFSVMSNIIIGSWLALLYFQKKSWLLALKDISKLKVIVIYFIGFIVILFKNKLFLGSLIVFQQVVISLFFAFIIFDQIYLKNSIFKIGKIKIFNHLGKISYGLYLYHLLVLYLLLKFGMQPILTLSPIFGIIVLLFMSILGTYSLAYLSFNFFEKPFLTLKNKFN